MIKELQKDKNPNQVRLIKENGCKEELSYQNRILKSRDNNNVNQLVDKYKYKAEVYGAKDLKEQIRP